LFLGKAYGDFTKVSSPNVSSTENLIKNGNFSKYDESGNLCLVRDQGHVIGPLNARTQLALRTVFTKIFPPSRTVPLVPPMFEADERFAQLTTGMCRLENGWFALAIVEKKDAEP